MSKPLGMIEYIYIYIYYFETYDLWFAGDGTEAPKLPPRDGHPVSEILTGLP